MKRSNDYINLLARLNDGSPSTGGLCNLRAAINSLPVRKIDSILEIGSNNGIASIAISEMLPDCKVTGLEIEESMIKKAESNLEKAIENKTIEKDRIKFVNGNAEKQPFPNESFDLVVFSGSLSFIKDRQRAIIEANRVLKTGGFLLTMDYYRKSNSQNNLEAEISTILGFDVSKTTLDYWIDIHSSEILQFEGLETKNPTFHSFPTRSKIQNLKNHLEEENIDYQESDIKELKAVLDKFQLNEKYVGTFNLLLRKVTGLIYQGGSAN